MSLSVHINGKPIGKVSSGVQSHQERFTQKEGLDVLKNTSSLIDTNQSVYNVSLFKSEVLKDKTVKQYVSDELKKVNEKRVNELGKRALRKDANTVGIGTFQIGDDSLEKLGFDKDKKWSEQSEQARKNVMAVYSGMVRNAVGKPDRYGKILTATLHVDESTPHVDFMTTAVDVERPEWTMREVLNGPPGSKRGARLREMQDDLDTIFSDDSKERFLLTRGESFAEKRDFAKETRNVSKALDSEREVLTNRRKKLNKKERDLNERESRLEAREQGLEERENKVQSFISEASRRLREAYERIEKKVLNGREKAVVEYAQSTWSSNVANKTIFDVLDDKRMKEQVDDLMREHGFSRSKQKQKQREYGD